MELNVRAGGGQSGHPTNNPSSSSPVSFVTTALIMRAKKKNQSPLESG